MREGGQYCIIKASFTTYHQSGQTWPSPQGQCRWLVVLEVFEVVELVEGDRTLHIMVLVQDLPKPRRSNSNGSHSLRYNKLINDNIVMDLSNKTVIE